MEAKSNLPSYRMTRLVCRPSSKAVLYAARAASASAKVLTITGVALPPPVAFWPYPIGEFAGAGIEQLESSPGAPPVPVGLEPADPPTSPPPAPAPPAGAPLKGPLL